MIIDPKKTKNCLDAAQTAREVYYSYSHDSNDVYVSVNKLLKIVEKTYGKNVTLSFHEDSHELHYMYSFLVVDSNDNYEVCLMSEMTNCFNRFALCKELFHVILDEESVRNSTLQMHLHDFMMSMNDGNINGSASSTSEMLTEFAAMQFLFPYSKRLKFAKEVQERVGKNESKKDVYLDIATRLRIPRLYVERYLSDMFIEYFDPISWDGKSDGR